MSPQRRCLILAPEDAAPLQLRHDLPTEIIERAETDGRPRFPVKGAYGTFAGAHKNRIVQRYELDYRRRRYLHRNFAAFAGTIPKAISLIVPATIATGQANDPLVADPVVMNPYVFGMPDPNMAPGAPPR